MWPLQQCTSPRCSVFVKFRRDLITTPDVCRIVLYFAIVIYSYTAISHTTEQHPPTTSCHRHNYIRRWILGQTRKIDSDISPIPVLIYTGVKSAKFGLNFRLHWPLNYLWFETKQHLKSKRTSVAPMQRSVFSQNLTQFGSLTLETSQYVKGVLTQSL